MRPDCLLMTSTYDFSTLYTTLPHNLIKINLLKEPLIENALLTLHVTTETLFFYFR